MKVRVSIGLLATRFRVPETGEVGFIGVLSPSHYKKGNLVLQPLGGAAELTALGVVMALEAFQASQFHRNKEGGIDARFVIDTVHLEDALRMFEKRDSTLSDVDPSRELVDELAGLELPQNEFFPSIPPVLSIDDVGEIGLTFVRTVRQKFSDEPGTSTLATANVPSRRLFHLFEMSLPLRLKAKLETWGAVRFLTEAEVATTGGGVHKGVSAEGLTIADNFLWENALTD